MPGIKFTINLAKAETTGSSPFKLVSREIPHPMLVRTKTDLHGIREMAEKIRYSLSVAQNAIIVMQPSQIMQATKCRRPTPFNIRTKIMAHRAS